MQHNFQKIYIKDVKIIFKILNLDQSTKVTGYSLFTDNQLSDYGTLITNPKEKNPIERMKEQYDLIKKLIDKISPDFIVFEDCQFQQNYGTFQQLSQMQGVLMSILFEINIGFSVIQPTAWKSACGVKGKKRAEQKLSAIQIVKDMFGEIVTEDEADAIGIGLWSIKNIKIK